MNNCLHCGKIVKNKYCNVSCQNRHQKRKASEGRKQKLKETNKQKWKKFIVNCFICNKEIEIREFNVDKPKKEKYFCSRSCANKRIHSKETKEKISKSLGGQEYLRKCLYCEKRFITRDKNRKCCTSICARKNNIIYASEKLKEKIKNNPGWWSKLQKDLYKRGIQRVGGGKTKWYDYKNIRVQGTYELRTCKILDNWKENGKIKNWEYTKDRIEYIGEDSKKHSYLLDFKVFENNNLFYYIETKGYKRDKDDLKWKATRDMGYQLNVWFEEEIINEEKKL